jgi:valyl-tRNA synthetase
MSQELPKSYDPSLIEEKWSAFWIEERIFDVLTPAEEDAASSSAARPFVQLLPPPNVTGRLHIGHMLEHTQMDILARWHRMLGDTSVWVPGTDHAGIATQMMVERQLAAEGKQRTDFTREQFTERVWAWKQQYGSAITEQMKRLGASVDWSREYFTMDDRLSVAVKEAFVRLYEQGLIYRGAYIVNWDPVLKTAVSDLEVESEERAGSIYSIRYDLADGGARSNGEPASITVATTRPETMLGDVAVAVNPHDERYTAFIGKKLLLPLVGREIPVIADDWAQPEFGTGAVKVTPAHDPNDFAIGQRHHLPSPSIMDTEARISLEGSPYHGLDRFEARKRILADLEAAGHLVAVKDHTLTLPISQRTGSIIEPRLSMQWFVRIQPLADKAIAAVEQGHITFLPENNRKTYMEWMTNIHDWCISRQLWWGHRIPAWHCNACGCITVSRDAVTACSGCGITDIHQETDVLDTWFSSGLLPFTVFGWPGEGQPGSNELTPDLAAFYPTQQLVTGFDILFFWVARMIMLSCHFMLDVPMPDGSPRTLGDAVPFRNVYIHALVRDADRQKISKTKGNVIDPIEIVTKYGTDAVRFTLAAQSSPGTDIAFNEARTEGYRAFANKIWNAARFLQMNLDRGREAGYTVTLGSAPFALKGTGFSPSVSNPSNTGALAPEVPSAQTTPLETRWIFSRLSTVSAEVNASLADYRFDEAASAVYQFFWGEFCDWYLELVKLRLDFFPDDAGNLKPHSDATAITLTALVTVFEAALRLLSPFMPFLTEELWHALYETVGTPIPAKSIALTRYPQAADFTSDSNAEAGMRRIQDFISTIRNRRKELGVPEKELVGLFVVFDAGCSAGSTKKELNNVYRENEDMIRRLGRVSNMEDKTVDDVGLTRGLGWVSALGPDVAVIYERQIDVPAERERLTKDLAKFNKGLEAAEKQLGNEGFIARAPAHIVEGLKKQHAETLALKQRAEAALAALPAA